MARSVSTGRYTATAQSLHWIVAILMLLIVPIAWVMVNMPPKAPLRETLYMLHKSIGITILVLVAVRLAWRASHPAPRLPGRIGTVMAGMAHASHWLLYLILLGMPITGYLNAYAGGHPFRVFGLFPMVALVGHDPSLARVTGWLHVGIGQWAVYALVLLHLAATAFHIVVRRDGVLERMLPLQSGAIAAQAFPATDQRQRGA